MTDETATKVPNTLFDMDDVVIAMHWIADTTERVFRRQEKLYVHEEKSILSDDIQFIECFVMNNVLREYPWKGKTIGYHPKRFRLYEDTQTLEPFAVFNDLPSALQALLVADAEVSIEAQWRARFGGTIK
jgi:hypothetical protein